MVFKVADRVQEPTTTTGTGTLNLDGAATGFQTFVAGIGTTNTTCYLITDDVDWEVGIGTVTDATPDTLSRDTILASSNSGSAVNWGAGTKTVACTPVADITAVIPPLTSPAFSAGNFTGNASMTVTVADGEDTTYAYTIIGKMMTVFFGLDLIDVGGTPDDYIQIAIPESKTATKTVYNGMGMVKDNNTIEDAWCRVVAAGTVIQVGKRDETSWSASTALTSLHGQITFEID